MKKVKLLETILYADAFVFFWSFNKREEHEKTIKTADKKKKMLVIK